MLWMAARVSEHGSLERRTVVRCAVDFARNAVKRMAPDDGRSRVAKAMNDLERWAIFPRDDSTLDSVRAETSAAMIRCAELAPDSAVNIAYRDSPISAAHSALLCVVSSGVGTYGGAQIVRQYMPKPPDILSFFAPR